MNLDENRSSSGINLKNNMDDKSIKYEEKIKFTESVY